MNLRSGFVGARLLLSLLALAACGRGREVLPLPEAPGPGTKVALSPLELKHPEAFDRLDRRVLESDGPEGLVAVYDDLARVAPDDPRVLVRGALAALAADPKERGPAVAAGVLAKLSKAAPGDADAAWLALRVARLGLAPGGQALSAGSQDQAAALRSLAKEAEAFAAAHPGWKGPFGATPADAARIASEATAAADAYEASRAAPPAGEDAVAPAR